MSSGSFASGCPCSGRTSRSCGKALPLGVRKGPWQPVVSQGFKGTGRERASLVLDSSVIMHFQVWQGMWRVVGQEPARQPRAKDPTAQTLKTETLESLHPQNLEPFRQGRLKARSGRGAGAFVWSVWGGVVFAAWVSGALCRRISWLHAWEMSGISLCLSEIPRRSRRYEMKMCSTS